MPISKQKAKNKSLRKNKSFRQNKRALINKAAQNLQKWPKPVPEKSSMQIIDFFCGCGGMTAGFASLPSELGQIEILGGCDINETALATYSKNFQAPGVKGDVREIAHDTRAYKDFLKKIKPINRSKPLIVIGCAPCQGFSSHRKKNWAKDDPRNTLIYDFATIAVKLNPDCIVMENVPEMLSKKYWDYYEAAKNLLEDAGYIVRQRIYNTAGFGVPQERFRSLSIAMKKNFLMPEPILEAKDFLTVRDAIGMLPKIEAGKQHHSDAMHKSAGHKKTTLDTIKAVPKNGGSRPKGVGPKCLDKVKGFSDVYGRLYWDKPAITITHYARNPASGRYVHPEQNRGLTMREAALLQSFPTGFTFCGGFDDTFRQIGEAVPPKFSSAVAVNTVIELLSDELPQAEIISLLDVKRPVSSSYSSVIAGIKSKRKKAL